MFHFSMTNLENDEYLIGKMISWFWVIVQYEGTSYTWLDIDFVNSILITNL